MSFSDDSSFESGCGDYDDNSDGECQFEEIKKGLQRNDDTLLNDALNKGLFEVSFITSDNNDTLLHLVTKFSHIEAAKRIVQLGIGKNINARNNYGETPLFEATKCKDAEMFKFLLNNGADINIVPYEGPNFLQASLFWGSIETVEQILKRLFEKYVNQEEYKAEDDIQNCQKIVKFLSGQKTDVNFPDTKFSLLLYFVMRFGDEETFKLTLQKGNNFDINAAGPDHNPLLHRAILRKKFSFVDLLIDYGASIRVNGYADQNIIHQAVRANNPELVRFFLNHKIDVNGKTKYNQYTPLHFAVAMRNKEIVEILLKAGADIKAKFSNHSAVLNIVCGSNNLIPRISEFENGPVNVTNSNVLFDLEMIKFLLERGADTEVKDHEFFEPLRRACRAGRMDVVELLENYGADFFIDNSCKNNIIIDAVIGHNVKILDLLLRKGLDINASDYRGKTPLYYAVENVEIDAVPLIEFLLDNGADVYKCHAEGIVGIEMNDKTPLDQAVEWELSDVVECLLEWYTEMNIMNNQENRPIFSVFNYIYSDLSQSLKILIASMATSDVDIYNLLGSTVFQRKVKLIDEFYKACKLEIEIMKNTRFCEDRPISLYDFLASDLMKVTNFTNIAKAAEILESSEYQSQFPNYAFLLKKRIGRVKIILDLKNSIAEFLKKHTKLELPVDVLDHIFSYLHVGNVRNFGRALFFDEKRIS